MNNNLLSTVGTGSTGFLMNSLAAGSTVRVPVRWVYAGAFAFGVALAGLGGSAARADLFGIPDHGP